MSSKPFFYRITAADYLAALVTVPEADRGQWALDLALDMVTGNVDTARSEFAKSIIIEANEFKQKKAAAGAKGGKAKASSAKAVLNSAVAESSTPLASSSNRSNNNKEESKPFAGEEMFNTFWAIFPKKTDKKKSRETFMKLAPDAELFDIILEAIEKQSAANEAQYFATADRWLRQEKWTDEIVEQSQGKPKTGMVMASPEGGYKESCV